MMTGSTLKDLRTAAAIISVCHHAARCPAQLQIDCAVGMPVRHGREDRHAARFGGPGEVDKARVERLAEDNTLERILVEESIRIHGLLEAQDLSAQFARRNDRGISVARDRLGLIA